MSHKCLFNTDLKQNDSPNIRIEVCGKTTTLIDSTVDEIDIDEENHRDEINIDTENIDEFIKILQDIKKGIA